MKERLAIFAVLASRWPAGPARAEKHLKDYSFIRGVNYGMAADSGSPRKGSWLCTTRPAQQYPHLAELPGL